MPFLLHFFISAFFSPICLVLPFLFPSTLCFVKLWPGQYTLQAPQVFCLFLFEIVNRTHIHNTHTHTHTVSDWACKTQEGHLVTVSLRMARCSRYAVGLHVQSSLRSLSGNRLQLLNRLGRRVTLWWYIFICVTAAVFFKDCSFSRVRLQSTWY